MYQNLYNTILGSKNEVKFYKEDNKGLISINGKINENLYSLFMKEYCNVKYKDDIIVELTTMGGELTWGYMISQILIRHEGHVEIRIPYYSMSAGTIIALSGNEIVLSNCGCLGPIDPYIFGLNVPTSTQVLREFNKESWYKSFFSFGIINNTLKKIIAKYGEKMLSRIDNDHKKQIKKLLKYNYEGDKVDEIYNYFTNENHHQTPIYYNDIPSNLHLNIKEDVNMLNKIGLRNNMKSKENPYSDFVNCAVDKYTNYIGNTMKRTTDNLYDKFVDNNIEPEKKRINNNENIGAIPFDFKKKR